MVKVSALIAFLAVSGASAFTVPTTAGKPSTALHMKNENKFHKFLTASVASAILLSSAATVPDALAASPDFDFGSNNVISARSGGRAGGRSSASSMRAPPPRARAAPAPTTTINRTTVIAAPSPVIAAPVVVSPFGYSPFGGIGYGALGAVNAIGNEMRDQRQENEIARERAELEVSKQRQAQLEQRLNELERGQVMQQMQINSK
jgi:hypothetical protein